VLASRRRELHVRKKVRLEPLAAATTASTHPAVLWSVIAIASSPIEMVSATRRLDHKLAPPRCPPGTGKARRYPGGRLIYRRTQGAWASDAWAAT
jgi:hypothetical protein